MRNTIHVTPHQSFRPRFAGGSSAGALAWVQEQASPEAARRTFLAHLAAVAPAGSLPTTQEA